MTPDVFQTLAIIFVVCLVVLVLDIVVILQQLRSLQMEHAGRKPVLRTKWGATDVFLGIQAALLLMTIAQLFIGFYLAAADPEFTTHRPTADDFMQRLVERHPIALLFMFLATQGGLLVTALAFVRMKYKATEDVYSFRIAAFGRQVALAAVWLLAVVGIGIVGTVGIGILMTQYESSSFVQSLKNLQDMLNPQESILKVLNSTGGIVAAYLLAGVVAPLCEESFFRLFVFSVFKNRWGLWAGVLLSSFLFAIFHGPVSAIVIFPIGICLALAYHSSGSIWTAILVHCFYNTVMVTLTVLFPKLAQ